MRVLPEHLRNALKGPLGMLVDEPELLRLLATKQHIVSIGDAVTYTLLTHHIKPLFCVIDYKTRRGACEPLVKKTLQSYGKKTVRINNPAGVITDELWDAIKQAYAQGEKETLRIEVEGEEDLAALVAIYLAPRDATIIYGLPNRGVVVVPATEEFKQKVKEILSEM